jgi:hypothetical protein
MSPLTESSRGNDVWHAPFGHVQLDSNSVSVSNVQELVGYRQYCTVANERERHITNPRTCELVHSEMGTSERPRRNDFKRLQFYS